MIKTFDNNFIGIAKRYAKALSESVQDKNVLKSYLNELENVLEIYDSSEDLRRVLILPTINTDMKKSILSDVLKDNVSDNIKKLLYLLIDENRFNAFPTIIYCFEEEINKLNNLLNVEVTSVIDLDDDIKNKLEDKLKYKLNKDISVDYQTNPALLGGLIIKYDGKTIDLSLNSKLENVKKQLNK